MRHSDNRPGSDYVFVGGYTIKIPKDVEQAAAALLLKISANKDITDAWEAVLRNVTDATLSRKLGEFGSKGDVVYTTELREDGIALLAFYAGPARK